MRIGLLAGAVGLAMGLPAVAKESKTDFREFGPDGRPVTPEFPFVAGKPTANGTMLDLSAEFGSVGRGSSGADGALATLFSDFESLAVLPAELLNQNDTGRVWGGSAAGVTGQPRFGAPTAPLVIPQYGVVTETVAGNSTKKLRGFASPAFGPNAFFGRWVRYDIWKTNNANGTGLQRFVFRPDTGQNCRLVHDCYVTAITSLWTSEPTYVSSGFIIGRLLWGGENATSGIGLPVGPIPDFFTLGPDPAAFLTGLFVPCTFPAGHPNAGQNVPVPVAQWFRIIHETDTGGNLIHKIDFNMGGPATEVEIYRALGIQVGRIDRQAYACGMEIENDACYVDNQSLEGVEFVLPTPPALECTGGMYVDNEVWLNDGPLTGQSTRWVDALSGRANVVPDGADKAIQRTNFFNDDRYRQELRTLLPLTFATPGNPFSICIEVDIASSTFFPNATVQTIAPASVSDNAFLSRLFIGRFDPANPPYLSRMYVQINPDYNPIDDENTVAPYSPGPNGNGGVPVIGTDVADTGVNWSFNGRRNVCFNIDANNNMTITVAGATVHTGTSFAHSIDQLHLESENNQPGAGNVIVYDDVVLTCSVLPPVTLPPFTLVYLDNLEWGIEGVTIGLHDDDNSSVTPFRWASAPNIPVVTLNVDGSTKVLKMENLFRDTPASLPNVPPMAGPPPTGFFQFNQASTQVPHVTASGTRGWVVKVDNLLTDSETSRTWSAAQGTISTFLFNRVAGITFSSVSDTFWYQVMDGSTPDPDDTTWLDTGTTLSGAGASLNAFFGLAIHRNLNGNHTFRINGNLLTFTGGPNNGMAVTTPSLQSTANGVHKDLDRLFFFGSDEDSAPVGSILYADNVRAWSLPCLGDTNNNGVVDFADLNNVLGFFGQSTNAASGINLTGNIAPDANNDGVPDVETLPNATQGHQVSFTDLNTVLSGFGVPCTSTVD